MPVNQAKILENVDAMVAAGRITGEEAANLRAAANPDEFDRAMGAIRARHAGAHIDSAVARGEMTEAEATAALAELRSGGHPKGLRARARIQPQPLCELSDTAGGT
jgi:polyhydroxyalkanoate synthesis regulator phasin